LSAAGFYPVTPGSTVYAIGAPLFPEVRFNLEYGKPFVVRAVNASERNVYIQSATLNGKPYRKSFFFHDDLVKGGELVFVMGPRPNVRWGVGAGNEPVSRIAGPEIVPVPVIKAAGQTFRGRMQIDLAAIDGKPVAIYYTTDGSDPSAKSQRFTTSFFIEADTIVKALSVAADGSHSLVATASFHRIPHDWKISLETSYSSQYTGGGDNALIDGLRGTKNWSGGGWQGYQGKDFVAVVDLGNVRDVSKVGAGFLQDAGSWIYLPARVEVEVSMDGRSFSPAISIANEVSEKQEGVVIRDFVKSVSKQARYIRIRAVNLRADKWIFVDEILIQ
jgi:hypothetical protein